MADGEARPPLPAHLPPGDGDAVVAARVERRVFDGPDGLRSLPVDARFEARDSDGFHAEIVQAKLGAVVLRRSSMTAHRAVVDGTDRGQTTDVLRLIAVKDGMLMAAPPGGRPVRMAVGDALFTCRPRPFFYQANEPIVLVSSSLPVASLPAVLRRLEELPVGPLPHAPMVDAVVELLVNLTDRLDEPWSFDAEYAARGLIDLEAAILTEILSPQTPVPGPDRVYSAAVDFMERHLGEPDLRPPQIAEALGVSLRYLHRSFDDKEMTVARHLRERRLEQVAAALRATDRPPQLQLLASRFGFGSQDQLARAFRRRYGVSMTEYRMDTVH